MKNKKIKLPTVPVSGQNKRYGVIKLAQDVHAHSIVVCVQEEGQQPKAPRKMDPIDHLLYVQKLAAQSDKVVSCYEAGPTGFALHRQLTQLGVENIVIAPTRLDEHGKRVNNDSTDTIQLACRLDRYHAGNKRVFTVVRVPTETEEERRAWTRQRKQLQKTRLSLASRGRTLVLTKGKAVGNLWWHQVPWKKLQATLPAELLAHLEIFRRLILAVNAEIEKIDEELIRRRRALKEPKPKYAGDTTMELIESEVCDWNRFPSWRKAGSFCGLTGGVSASGQNHQDLSITKVGNKRLRAALIEMAWRLVRYQPNYWLTKKWAHVFQAKYKAHPRAKKKAIVAYARQLFVDLWKWKTGRTTAEKLGWEMC